MKKLFPVFLALPIVANAACGLSKNAADEYEVGTFEDLQKVGVEDCELDANYRLTADIKVPKSTDEWHGFPPIGGFSSPSGFSGEFHGAGHRIVNLELYNDQMEGLFGMNMDGLVDSLGLENVFVNGGTYTGAVVGWGGSGTISNVFVTGKVQGSGMDPYIGGIAGTFAGTIENCYFNGEIVIVDHVGGIVGKNEGTVKNSYAINEHTTSGGFVNKMYVGAIAGVNNGSIVSSYGMNYSIYQEFGIVGDAKGSSGNVDDNSAHVEPFDYNQKGAMQKQELYVGFDFENTWGIAEGKSEPFLKALLKKVSVTPVSAGVDYCSGKPLSEWVVLGESVDNRNYAGDEFVIYKDGKIDVDVSEIVALNQNGYVFVPVPVDAVIAPTKLTISGLSAMDKEYDGTTAVEISGTPKLEGLCKDDKVELVAGQNEFENAEVGNKKKVVVGYTLKGDESVLRNYSLELPVLTASITETKSSSSESSSSSVEESSSSEVSSSSVTPASSSSATTAIARGKFEICEKATRTYFDGHSVTIEKNGKRFDLMGNRVK